MRNLMKTALAGALALGLAMVVAAPAVGQQQPPPVVNVDDEKLEAFAKAYLDVQEINQNLEQALQQVGNDVEEAQSLQQRYGQQMIRAIERRDLEAEEYRNLIQAVNQDEEFRERFVEKLQEIQEEREPRSGGR